MRQILQREETVFAPPEYSVYIHHHPGEGSEDAGGWERKSKTFQMRQALQEARILHHSKDYRKVEVRKTFFNARHRQAIDVSLKIYEGRTPRKKRFMFLRCAMMVFCIAFSAVLIKKYM
jgi:hypothetical protein